MNLIEINALPNGAHRNQNSAISFVPDGWAVIPVGMDTPNFPFGEVETDTIDGVVTVTKWTALPMPDPEPIPEPEPTTEERVAQLERDNQQLTAKLQAAVDSNAFLEECIVEMAGIVYA